MNDVKLLPCPFCGHAEPYFERAGTPRQSCIVACGNCGCRHESGDEGSDSGRQWNTRADATCALRGAQKESGWISVRDSLPPCDGETMFIGENEAGYIACFNGLSPDGYCFHASAEDEICVMSGLRMWKRVDRPSAPTPEGEAK